MRARSLKPGFFQNEDLIELPFEYRLLFAGLWTMADREGRLEDRPKKIKLTLFPGDNVDCDAGLTALHDKGFIIRYENGKNRFIQVKNWSKHQSPHIKEAASTLPPHEEHQTSTVQAPDKPRADTSVAALTPSSLTPDSGLLTPERGRVRARAREDPRDAIREVDRLKAAYPKGTYPLSDWLTAERDARARVDEGHSWEELVAGCERYAAQCVATRSTGTQYVQSPKKFFALPECRFREPFPLPAKIEKTHPEDTGWRPSA